MALSNDTKIKVGSEENWFWVSPMPVSQDGPSTLTVEFKTPTYSATRTLTRVYTDLVVQGLGSDQKTLTVEFQPTITQGLAGPAWLITGQGETFPVRIEKIVGTTIVLEDAINTILTFSSEEEGSLQFATWYAPLDTTLTDEVRKNVNWSVFYSSGSDGANAQARELMDSGIVQIVEKPFATSLSHSALLGYFPNLVSRLPDRQSSFLPQIEAAERELIVRLRGELRPLGQSEDDIEGAYFQPAHAYLTASLILYGDLDTFTQAAELRTIYDTNFKETLKRVLVDTDEDGVTDTDEGLSGGFNGATTSSFLQSCFHRPFKFRVDGRI